MNEDKQELISIIIPCFNSGIILKRAIDSVLKQTWKEKEIILVNDGSTDSQTLDLIKNLKKIKDIFIINQENLGLPKARNNGANLAKGSYLFFLDSDDWIEPETLELMYNRIKEIKEISYIFSDIIIEGKVQKLVKKEYNFFEQLFLNQLPYSIFLSKDMWIKYGGYDESMKSGYEDWEFNIRLGSHNLYGNRLPKALFHYNVSNAGMLLSKSSKNHAQIIKNIISRNPNLYGIKNLIKIWLKWRQKSSSYPLIIFFPWYLIIKIFPSMFVSNLFILMRNTKWLFTRNQFLISIKNIFVKNSLLK